MRYEEEQALLVDSWLGIRDARDSRITFERMMIRRYKE